MKLQQRKCDGQIQYVAVESWLGVDVHAIADLVEARLQVPLDIKKGQWWRQEEHLAKIALVHQKVPPD